MTKDKTVLKNYSPTEVFNLISQMDEPSYRGTQILDWLYKKKAYHFDEMTNLPLYLREKLKKHVQASTLQIKERIVSPKDGTVKYLFKTMDEQLIECAVMKQDYGNTVCVSSQIGCGLGCVFCASTRGGLVRNLTSGEMLDQVIMADKHLSSKENINNIVVMGMGEPMLNLSNLVQFLETAHDPKGLGISYRNMTVSTSGITPQIYKFAQLKLPVTLAVSLHAPDNKTRSRLMPVNNKHPLEDLLESCQTYINKTGRRVTFEYILLAGINDHDEKAQQLAFLTGELLCHINLIPANQVGGHNLRRPETKRTRAFLKILSKHNISASIRKERGADIEGACGQLRRRYDKEK